MLVQTQVTVSECQSVCVCVAGLHLALHPTQVLGRLVLIVAPPRSVPTPATHPSAALSVAAALGKHLVCVCVSTCI